MWSFENHRHVHLRVGAGVAGAVYCFRWWHIAILGGAGGTGGGGFCFSELLK